MLDAIESWKKQVNADGEASLGLSMSELGTVLNFAGTGVVGVVEGTKVGTGRGVSRRA